MGSIQSKFVEVQGVRTHYLEGGAGPKLVLLHSGEFGGCAEITWEFNIEKLARQFRVYAPTGLDSAKPKNCFRSRTCGASASVTLRSS
jgi:2-hydroxymuconate-semialdehyde hydrolase